MTACSSVPIAKISLHLYLRHSNGHNRCNVPWPDSLTDLQLRLQAAASHTIAMLFIGRILWGIGVGFGRPQSPGLVLAALLWINP